jgi:hypothetical protein
MPYVDDFARDGFAIVPMFESQELFEFAVALAGAGAAFSTDGEMYDCLAASPQFLRLAAKRDMQEIANELLGRPRAALLYGFTWRCRIDRPGATFREYGWHQEVFYTVPHARFVQSWAPLLADATEEGGTIEVCPGSHRDGVARQAYVVAENHQAEYVVADEVVARYEARPIPVKLGDVLFFDPKLIHRSGLRRAEAASAAQAGHNRSRDTRYTMVGMYHDPFAPRFRVPIPSVGYRGPTPGEEFARCASAW